MMEMIIQISTFLYIFNLLFKLHFHFILLIPTFLLKRKSFKYFYILINKVEDYFKELFKYQNLSKNENEQTRNKQIYFSC